MRSVRRGRPGAWPVFPTGGTGAHPGMRVAVGGVRLEPLPVRIALCIPPEDTRDRRWPTSPGHGGLRRAGPPPILRHSAPCDCVCGARVGAGQGEPTWSGWIRKWGFRGMASTLAARTGVGIGREEGGYAWSGGERRWWTVRARAVGRWRGPELGAPRCTMCQGVARANRAPDCGMWRRSRVAVARSRVGAVARREEPNGGYP